MKWILFLGVLGAAGYLGYQYWYKADRSATSTESASGDSFMDSCRHVSRKIPRVDEYCTCLKDRGVNSMVMLGARPAGREAIAACQEEVGYTAPTPGLNP